MARSEDQLSGWRRLADSGNPDAQIVMAWEYAKGKLVPKDFDRAIALFRAAEPARGRLARFNLAKAMILNGDPSFSDVIRQDCDGGFGPALYLMGVTEARGTFHERNVDKALHFFSLGAKDHHLLSACFAWRLQRKSFIGWLTSLPYGIGLGLRVTVLNFRDPNDLRILGI
jgi:TPR repeat protein